MSEHPLGLPKGSVRAIISILVVIAVALGAILERPILGEIFRPVLALVVGLYFGGRQKEGGN
jgi:hypothetical protein